MVFGAAEGVSKHTNKERDHSLCWLPPPFCQREKESRTCSLSTPFSMNPRRPVKFHCEVMPASPKI
eukprot:1117149-Pleurochrysis_carterae.AAC.1